MLGVLDKLVSRSRKQEQAGIDYVQSAITFRERRYLLVKAIFPRPILDYLNVYCGILLANNRFSKDDQCPLSLSIGGDPGLDAVLEWIRPEISHLVVGLKLVIAYNGVLLTGEAGSIDWGIPIPCTISRISSSFKIRLERLAASRTACTISGLLRKPRRSR
jgi:hypothetical protein